MSDNLQPPYSSEAERALIGGVLINPAIYEGIDLDSNDFYIERHRWVWSSVGRLLTKGSVPDFVTICDDLEARNKLGELGGPAYLTSLVNQTPSHLHSEHYALIVKEKSRRRKAIQIASELASSAFKETSDMDEVSASVIEQLSSSIRTKHDLLPIGTVMEETLDYLKEKSSHPSDTFGIPTGYIDLDRMTGGVEGLWYLGGEPGVGKSILMLSIIVNAAKRGHAGAIFSAEMSNLAQGLRLLSAEAKLPTLDLKSGKISDEEWILIYKMASEISQLPIYICDEPELSTTQMRAHLAKAKAEYGVSIFALDYMYLLTDSDGIGSTVEKTEMLSKRVKALQRSFGIAGITVNSVTKEGMDGKAAKSTSLRGSGQLIHDADVVLFITKHSTKDNLRVLELTKGRDVAELGKMELLKTDSYPTFKDVTYQQEPIP